MNDKPIQLLDANNNRIADLDVEQVGDIYRGTINLNLMPQQIKQLFDEFEELVESQVFNLADEVEEKIAMLAIRAKFAFGNEEPVEDLQVYPSTQFVSFRARMRVNPAVCVGDCGMTDSQSNRTIEVPGRV